MSTQMESKAQAAEFTLVGSGNEGFDAWSRLLRQVREATEYDQFLPLIKEWKKLLASGRIPPRVRTVRLALLGGATTELLQDPLLLALEGMGIGCSIYRADYGTFIREMLEASSPTAQFRPEIAIVLVTPHHVPHWPRPGDDLHRIGELAQEVSEHWIGLSSKLHEHTGCEVILNNFHPLPIRPQGNLGAKLGWDPNNFLRRVNRELGDRAPAFVHINDIEDLSARYGLNQWFDSRYWYLAKQPVSFSCLLPLVRNLAQMVSGLLGRSSKCLVLDLDNTLWGGVVGDDGPEGIIVGEGDPVGEAYKAFQEYLKRLKERGVLLAVCSKNEESNARAPFVQRPDMVLRLEDFVAFKANWRPKGENLREIAAELNLGLDALVFVDDNPVEREQVRQAVPEVQVVELSEDPADYLRQVDQTGLFEVPSLSREDAVRTQQYQQNQQRSQSLGKATDYASYLKSLQQRAVMKPFEDPFLDRITQLINKSNQYNLTTLRLTRSQVEERMRDPKQLTVYVRLADRFGDNGLISVCCGQAIENELWIEEWLMSCRVLQRGVEQLLCNYLVEKARERGLSWLHGVYIPTARNQMVQDHYEKLGFEAVREDLDGTRHWRLNLQPFRPFEVPIELVEEY